MNSAQRLKKIFQLSKSMLDHASAGAWEQLTQLEAERQTQIDACFPLDDSIQDVEVAGEQIKSILALDSKTMALTKERQSLLGQTMSKINKGRHATKTYEKNAK